MTRRRISGAWCVLAAGMLASFAAPSHAITIVPDYTYDTTNFFGAGNPNGQGAAAKAALEAVTSYYSTILTDTFSAISKPANLVSTSGGGGIAFWDWTMTFTNPTTGADVELQNQTIAADAYRLYVGASSIVDEFTLGVGGPGGFGWSASNNGGGFSVAEITQINQTTAGFSDAVTDRGETSGFGAWGGAITFDRDGSTVWHYNHNTAPAAGTSDFYSVAVHEIGHALGLGTSTAWTNLATGANFSGMAAAAAYGGPPPLESPERSHWAPLTLSKILGTNTVQEAAMTPEVLVGSRKHLTSLDAGALTDIGWSVVVPAFNSADFNRDGTVNGPDLAIWRSAFGASTAADANGDGFTDGDDLLLWQRRLGQVGPAVPAGSPVPEPAGAVLAAWIIAVGVRVRRRNVGASA